MKGDKMDKKYKQMLKVSHPGAWIMIKIYIEKHSYAFCKYRHEFVLNDTEYKKLSETSCIERVNTQCNHNIPY